MEGTQEKEIEKVDMGRTCEREAGKERQRGRNKQERTGQVNGGHV